MKTIDLLALLALAGCDYRPARFSTEPPRWSAGDERPVAMPTSRRPNNELYHLETYGERAVVSTLEVSHPPLGVDVNSFDEVVRSSWYRGRRAPDDDGPPEPPLTRAGGDAVLPGAEVWLDARGLRYELLGDAEGHPETRTAAVAIASGLLRAVGYHAAEAHVIDRGGERQVAVRWPGVDLGPTPMLWTRSDDPNDVLPHVHRRTLRATLVFALWLGIDDIHEHSFRDVYLGDPPRGFVRHYFVGLEEAFGAGGLDPGGPAPDPRADGSSATLLLVTFGLTPRAEAPRPLPFPGVARFGPAVELDADAFQPPFAAHQRLRPDDAYWAGKTMAALDDDALASAVDAGRLGDPRAARYLLRALERRRAALLREIYAGVSPCDALRVVQRDDVELSLVDRVLEAGLARGPRRYQVEVLDGEGEPLRPPRALRFTRARRTLRLPADVLGDYAVVRVRATGADRAADFHLGRVGGAVRLLGVEH